MAKRLDVVLRHRVTLVVFLVVVAITLPLLAEPPQGMYFDKKE